MTEQEIFNKAYITLRERGFTRAGALSPEGLFRCCYRSPVGPCALGACIPDEEYDPLMDSREVWGFSTSVTISKISAFQGIRNRFLTNLQECHDNGFEPNCMRIALENFARRRDLAIPE